MITIHARLADGLMRIQVTGHEEHREDGRVCAAISAIVQTALLGVAEIARQHPDLVTIDIKED